MEKKYNTYLWLPLAVGLLAGLLLRPQEWSSYWALWVTEIVTVVLLALYFYFETLHSAIGAFVGAIVWLINQGLCWRGYGNQIVISGFNILYVVTAIAAISILVYVGLTRKSTSVENQQWFGMGAFIVMTVFCVWKIYEVTQQFVPGTAMYASALTWGAGILLMSSGSIVYVAKKWDETMAITVIGLLLAWYAAVAYGMALSVAGV